MTAIKVKEGEELNGLGVMLKEIMDTNLADPEKHKSVERVKASVVIRESTSGVAVTLHLNQGKLELQAGGKEHAPDHVNRKALS